MEDPKDSLLDILTDKQGVPIIGVSRRSWEEGEAWMDSRQNGFNSCFRRMTGGSARKGNKAGGSVRLGT
jgi:hypothetical protein